MRRPRPLRRLKRWAADSPPLTARLFYSAFALLFLIATLALIGEGLLASKLASANRHRIADVQAGRAAASRANARRIAEIQKSRFDSCQTTYRAFALFFRPFFPADRTTWSAKQKSDWRKLTDRGEELARSRCARQTRPRGEP